MVREWYADLSRRLPGRARKAYRLLRAIVATAVADELIPRNPCQVKGASIDRSAECSIPTVAEVEALASSMPKRCRLLVQLTARCGLRRGEVLALRRRDVDMVQERLIVERACISFGTARWLSDRRRQKRVAGSSISPRRSAE